MLAHVGDSRVYRFDGDALSQLSVDHSVVQQLIEEGVLSPAEARRAPNRNIVTRAVGIDAQVQVDVARVRLAPGEILLLCTDGLTDVVDDDLIRGRFADHGWCISELADVLIEDALDAGGTDNVSVVLVAG